MAPIFQAGNLHVSRSRTHRLEVVTMPTLIDAGQKALCGAP